MKTRKRLKQKERKRQFPRVEELRMIFPVCLLKRVERCDGSFCHSEATATTQTTELNPQDHYIYAGTDWLYLFIIFFHYVYYFT